LIFPFPFPFLGFLWSLTELRGVVPLRRGTPRRRREQEEQKEEGGHQIRSFQGKGNTFAL
jgi:hypothetical protein